MRHTQRHVRLLILVLLLTACSGLLQAEETAGAELIVFTAASLTDAFTEIGAQFEVEHPGSTVIFNFAGSQQLAQQLAEGAPADLFASADRRQMEEAIDGGHIETGTVQTFARNRLIVVFPADNPAGIETLQDLRKPGLKLVLAAETVPIGGYSLEFLDRATGDETLGAGFRQGVLGNVVSYEENVRAVLSKILLGEADAGIVYTSDLAPESTAQVGRIDIPDHLNVIATYPIAVVKDSAEQSLARAFIDSVLSEEGQAILARYGFMTITE